jgi:hypothetical protein
LLGEASGDRIHFDGSLRERDAGGEASDYVHVTTFAAVSVIGGEDADGDDDVGAIEKAECRRENADDGEAAAIEGDGAADDGGIATQMGFPELVAEQEDGSGSRFLFRG